ncbi:hypothetical protein ACET8Y_03625 [Aeromonas veronii]
MPIFLAVAGLLFIIYDIIYHGNELATPAFVGFIILLISVFTYLYKECYTLPFKDDPYKSVLPNIIKTFKVRVQFLIGFTLIIMLMLKGGVEVIDTFIDLKVIKESHFLTHLYQHFTIINTFSYIASALAISAGLDLGYMLFTKGPDEALEPLLLGITSAAFYTLSNSPDKAWIIGIYALSLLVVIYCMKKYRDWNLNSDD